MEVDELAAEKPDAFLCALGESLKSKEDIDQSLAEILRVCILRGTPAPNAVALAKSAILTLAASRANAPKPEAIDG